MSDIDLATPEERLASMRRMKADADRNAESWRQYSRKLAEELDEVRKRIETFEESSAEQTRCINRWAERYDALVAALQDIARKCSLGPATYTRPGDTPEQRNHAALYNLVVYAADRARLGIADAERA